MNQRIRVSCVSYLNSLPFIYGLQQHPISEQIELTTDIPSSGARKMIDGTADLGLLPVAVLPMIPKAIILKPYGIGADGDVRSVMLFSEVPLDEIETILLDYHSRTSVLLVQKLANQFWKIAPQFLPAQPGFETEVKGNVAGLVIGDRALAMHGSFHYSYDLSLEWKKFTGRPFVFACWVANRPLENDFVNAFNEALGYGLTHLETIPQLDEYPPLSRVDAIRYLRENIQHRLTDPHWEAMDVFLKLP